MYLQPMIPHNRSDIFSPAGRCSEGLDAFNFFFEKLLWSTRFERSAYDHEEVKRLLCCPIMPTLSAMKVVIVSLAMPLATGGNFQPLFKNAQKV